MKDEIVDIDDEKLKIVNEIGEEDRTIEGFKKVHPKKFMKLEEALIQYMGENDPKTLKSEVSDNKWKYLIKKNSTSL